MASSLPSSSSSSSSLVKPAGVRGALVPTEISDIEPRGEGRTDLGRAARIGLWTLVLGFGGFLAWAAFAPLDEGVPSMGQVVIDTKRKSVQHLSGGIVKEVLVREGDVVKEGQLLVRLDDAVARASFESVRQRYLGMLAMQSRLLAEQTGETRIRFLSELDEHTNDPLIRQQMRNQEQLMRARQAAHRAELQSIQENIEGQRALGRAYESMIGSRRSQLALVNEELTQTRGLVAEGYMPRNRQLELERQAAEIQSALADLEGNIVRAQRSVAELQQRALARREEYRKEVETQLADLAREAPAELERYRALQNDLTRTEIRSPASGQVVGLAIQTVGGVVGAGQKLMDVVPGDETLLLETQVMPHFIDRVRAGMPVDVRFSAFSHEPQLVVDGRLISVSSDLLTDPVTGMGYYLSRVELTPEGREQLGKRTMQPGMPVEVIFRTGERSLLVYMLSPLTKRIAASMTEE